LQPATGKNGSCHQAENVTSVLRFHKVLSIVAPNLSLLSGAVGAAADTGTPTHGLRAT
jgi:hypothetical protein